MSNWVESNRLQSKLKRAGFWKMNFSLPEDANYLEELKQNIPLWKTTGSDNLSDKRCIWDWLKYNIRKHAILFSKKKARERSAMEQKLKSIRGSNQNIRTGPFRLLNLNTLNEAKNILESYYEEKTRGVIIRARARWHEHGERSTKYFLNLEKRNHVKKTYKKTASKWFHYIWSFWDTERTKTLLP